MKSLNNSGLKNLLLIVFMCAFLCSCLSGQQKTKVIVDVSGDSIAIPKEVNKVINLVTYGAQTMISLGMGDKLIGISEYTVESDWIETIYPRISAIKKYKEDENAESLLSAKADLIIVETQEQAVKLRNKGLCAISFFYYTIDDFKKNIMVLAEIFPEASDRCSNYLKYFDDNIADINNQLKDKIKTKKSIYYITARNNNKGFYKTCGKGSTLSYCANLAFVDFATDSLINTPTTYVDSEAIIGKNPDIIIIGGLYQHKLKKEIYQSYLWKNVNAIKQNQVYLIPMSVTGWNRYGIELSLYISWTAKIAYPDLYDKNLEDELIFFYKNFANIDISTEQAHLIVSCHNPTGGITFE